MNFNTRVNPFAGSTQATFKANMTFPPSGGVNSVNALDTGNKLSFKDVMVNMVKDTDHTMTLPDELMNRALTTGDVDIHEVMIANTKADLAINIVSQVVGKVISAYERVQQIQV